jgi:hypothetical protein
MCVLMDSPCVRSELFVFGNKARFQAKTTCTIMTSNITRTERTHRREQTLSCIENLVPPNALNSGLEIPSSNTKTVWSKDLQQQGKHNVSTTLLPTTHIDHHKEVHFKSHDNKQQSSLLLYCFHLQVNPLLQYEYPFAYICACMVDYN